MYLYSFNMASKGSKDLANRLGIKRIKREGSNFVGGPNKLVINWGCSKSTPQVDKCQVLNHPSLVAKCTDKLEFFQAIKAGMADDDVIAPNIPYFTEDYNEARELCRIGHTIVCRTVLNGHSGDGIVIAKLVDEVVRAPLYTMYIPKKEEFRIHFMMGEVIDAQRKARDVNRPLDDVNWQIRSHNNGFVFVRNDIIVPDRVLTEASRAVKMFDLHFGAVDVVYNQSKNKAFVLEINTAPGMEGMTLENYANGFEAFRKKWEAENANN